MPLPAGIDHLRRLRANDRMVAIDGGMGTELEAQGAAMDHEAWSGVVNLVDPALVQSVHEAFVAAGADVLITNTFMSGIGPLGRAGERDRFVEANRNAVRAARAAGAAGDRPVVVAGSVSVTELGAPEAGEATGRQRRRRLRDGYLRQIEILVDEEVDLIALEMADDPLYAEPAVEAAVSAELALWLGLCVVATHSGRAPDRPAVITAAHREVLALAGGDPFDAVCVMHTDVDDVPDALGLVNETWTGPIGVYPHRGVWLRPRWQFADLPVQEFVDQARGWQAAGATMIGGCCGIRPAHIAALRSAA